MKDMSHEVQKKWNDNESIVIVLSLKHFHYSK